MPDETPPAELLTQLAAMRQAAADAATQAERLNTRLERLDTVPAGIADLSEGLAFLRTVVTTRAAAVDVAARTAGDELRTLGHRLTEVSLRLTAHLDAEEERDIRTEHRAEEERLAVLERAAWWRGSMTALVRKLWPILAVPLTAAATLLASHLLSEQAVPEGAPEEAPLIISRELPVSNAPNPEEP